MRDQDLFNLGVPLEDLTPQEKLVNQLQLALDPKNLNRLLSEEKWLLSEVKSNRNVVDLQMIADEENFLLNQSNRKL